MAKRALKLSWPEAGVFFPFPCHSIVGFRVWGFRGLGFRGSRVQGFRGLGVQGFRVYFSRLD